ncbi:hypothetical protein [Aestuariivirga sp.]|uniref:hypothetical protein n=1 Tax=Aestuariivirga sp. TaxID=2650926 RepID=UPI00391B46D4
MGIRLKRSAVASKAPVVADLEPGELAVNTWDGKLYLKKIDGAEAIVEVGPVRSVAGRTGAVALGIADVASLQTALDGKQAAGSYAAAAHNHAISNVTGLQAALDAKADLTAILGKQTIWVPASAMTPRITNGAVAGTVETATNKVMLKTLDFDTATQEFAQFSVRMPKGWDEGALQYIPIWLHPSTTTSFGVTWQLQAVALSDGDAADAAFGTAIVVTDTGGATNTFYAGVVSGNLTVAGSPAQGDTVIFQVARAPANVAVEWTLRGILRGAQNSDGGQQQRRSGYWPGVCRPHGFRRRAGIQWHGRCIRQRRRQGG